MDQERRLLLFFLVAAIVLTAHMMLNQWLAPPRPRPQGKDQVAKNGASDKPQVKGEEAEPAEVGPEKNPPPSDKPPEFPDRRFSLGSLDETDGFGFLVTLRSRGGAIERVELTNPPKHIGRNFYDQDDLSGYLGHLGLTAAKGKHPGCRVDVVGAGTPAAHARRRGAVKEEASPGLTPGDVIEKLGDEPTPDPAAFAAQLAATSPGDTIKLTVFRPADPEQKDSSDEEGLEFDAVLARRPVEVVRPESSLVKNADGKIEEVDHPPSLLVSLVSLAGKSSGAGSEISGLPSLRESNWEARPLVDGLRKGIEFTYRLSPAMLRKVRAAGSLELVKRYWLQPAEDDRSRERFHLDLELEIRSTDDKPLSLAYQLEGFTGLPLEGWSYVSKPSQNWSGVGPRDVIYRQSGLGNYLIGSPTIVSESKGEVHGLKISRGSENVDVTYVGVDAPFFAAVVLPQATKDVRPQFTKVDALHVAKIDPNSRDERLKADVSFRLESPELSVSKDEPLVQSFRLFMGPKSREVLNEYALGDAVQFGWWWWVSPVILWILHVFYWLTQNFGVSIVLLTVLVRGCMFPISLKAVRNSLKMQEIKPEIDKLREKHKKDQLAMAKAQEELFRKHKINLFGGCLPLLLQIPVFGGLYRALQVEIDLRQAPLVPGWHWCSNLAAPDHLFRWDGILPKFLAGDTGYFGPYFNILPVITIALFLFNQKMVLPPPKDENDRMQHQMMTFMTVFMGVMWFKVPAGLCIYFIASSLWSMAERQCLPKPAKPAASSTPQKGSPSRSGR